MNFVYFRNSLRDSPVFSLSDARSIFDNFDRRRLSEWQEKGYIRKIIKGHYLFSETPVDEGLLWTVANKIYKPSYISFETAMSHYRLIPESVYMITSVSTRRTYRFETPLARFSYRTLKPSLFFGYTILSGGIRMASMEKAVLDYFYLNPGIQGDEDFSSLRINRDEVLERFDRERFAAYARRFGQKRLLTVVEQFLSWMGHA